jgi:hypothetical protein
MLLKLIVQAMPRVQRILCVKGTRLATAMLEVTLMPMNEAAADVDSSLRLVRLVLQGHASMLVSIESMDPVIATRCKCSVKGIVRGGA